MGDNRIKKREKGRGRIRCFRRCGGTHDTLSCLSLVISVNSRKGNSVLIDYTQY